MASKKQLEIIEELDRKVALCRQEYGRWRLWWQGMGLSTGSTLDGQAVPEKAGVSRVLSFHVIGKRIVGFIGGMAQVCLILAWFAFLTGTIAGGWWWFFDLFSHYVPYYALGGGVALFWFAILRWWRWAVAAALLMTLNGALMAVWYLPCGGAVPSDAPSFSLLHWNVNMSNRNHKGVLDTVHSRNPDVICLNEVGFRWAEAFREIETEYPYRHVLPRNDCFGIAVFSRIPLGPVEEIYLGGSKLPALSVTLSVAGKPVRLLAMHTLPPVNAELAKIRNAQLKAAAAWVRQENSPSIVAGDLNVTMWSPVYRDFMRASGLTNARRGFGVLPTWRLNRRMPFLLPIDHVVTSLGISVKSVETGKSCGSDHLPVESVLMLP